MSGFFIYCRKASTSENSRTISKGFQIRELKRFAAKHNLTIVDVLVERESASVKKRPIFRKMMRQLHRGGAKGIVCWQFSHLTRSFGDLGLIVSTIRQRGIQIMTLSQTPAELKMNILKQQKSSH